MWTRGLKKNDESLMLDRIISCSASHKKVKGFDSIHIVTPPMSQLSKRILKIRDCLTSRASDTSIQSFTYVLDEKIVHSFAIDEYNAIFEVVSQILLNGANRRSLLIFVGADDTSYDAFAPLIGMLPFRGIATSLISQYNGDYNNFLKFITPSSVFQLDLRDAARLGLNPVTTIFGPKNDHHINARVNEWLPIKVDHENNNAVSHFPFKIKGLELPMYSYNGKYDEALDCLGRMLRDYYGDKIYPIVSCGESCSALRYGQDVLDSIQAPEDFFFTHKSGESYKRYDNYGTPDLFSHIAFARRVELVPIIIAVGGGVNGNSIGLVASMTGVDLIEIPTTIMHFNDATTSAKKAMSLIVDDTILSKNIMGTFYIPKLVYSITEMLLTITTSHIEAAVGEACKTMNMLGNCRSSIGILEYHNIIGAHEFASDFTKIVKELPGYEEFMSFVRDDKVTSMKMPIVELGNEILSRKSRLIVAHRKLSRIRARSSQSITSVFGPTLDLLESKSFVGFSEALSMSSPMMSDEEIKEEKSNISKLEMKHKDLMVEYRQYFHDLSESSKSKIISFLTTINREIIAAKAMFLAYSDPFEKYRALLFEYAHTMGHGVEAFINKLYVKAKNTNILVPNEAIRLHGQCVGMAVVWAGEMSRKLDLLTDNGYILHQALVFTFNKFGGFSFRPLRDLCECLNVSRDEFIDGVLDVIRRDNKRGYCSCSTDTASVDQLVKDQPGRMLRSSDPDAEIRYLVEINEDLQKEMLGRAYDCEFDCYADIIDNQFQFIHSDFKSDQMVNRRASANEMGTTLHRKLDELFVPSCLPCTQFD